MKGGWEVYLDRLDERLEKRDPILRYIKRHNLRRGRDNSLLMLTAFILNPLIVILILTIRYFLGE